MKHSTFSQLIAAAVLTLSLISCHSDPGSSLDATAPNGPSANQMTGTLAKVPQSTRIPGSYIVVLNDNVADPARVASEIAQRYGLSLGFTYTNALKGFSFRMSNPLTTVLESILQDSRVDYIEEDRVVYSTVRGEAGTQSLTITTSGDTVRLIPWSISATGADSSSTQSGNGSGSVTNVRIYIIDTGIQPDHPDLNVVGGRNFASGNANAYGDGNGHGTHVAGIAAARDNSSYVVGMCPGAPLYAVRVFDANGSGSASGVISGIDWVCGQKKANPTIPMVANLNLAPGQTEYADLAPGQTEYADLAPGQTEYIGGNSIFSGDVRGFQVVDKAVANCMSAGVLVVTAAGDDGVDATSANDFWGFDDTTSFSVGATGTGRSLASFSNYGSGVDILAPGVDILSTCKGSTTATLSGTSMAAAHVTGAVALYLSSHPNASPSAVATALVNDAGSWISHTRSNTTHRMVRVTTY